jgi:hypothetical protein
MGTYPLKNRFLLYEPYIPETHLINESFKQKRVRYSPDKVKSAKEFVQTIAEVNAGELVSPVNNFKSIWRAD